VLHALGIGREPERPGLRVAGMVLTLAALTSGALSVLGPALAGLRP
jgi:hypothetical protein